jgi:M6 family metalloprotease-like protein
VKKLFVIVFVLSTSLKIFSAPLFDIPVTVSQPDGVVLNLLASGDEFYNWLHDYEHFTIVQNRDGYYVYAKMLGDKLVPTNFIVGSVNPYYTGLEQGLKIPDKDIIQKRDEFYANSPKDMGKAPKKGTINNLTVFIRFADESEFTDSIAYYNRIFNCTNSGWNSMYNYFKDASYGNLFVTSTFYPAAAGGFVVSYKDSHNRNYYKPYDSVSNPTGYTNQASREHTLLRDAINYIASMVPAGLNIDGDNDGKVDNVCFIVDGATTAWNTLLWPHRWTLFSYTVNINGKRVYDYNLQIQSTLKSSGPGVLCHEMFHSLGSPDLYRYVNSTISPCSSWDIMCSNTNPPQHMGAYMKYKYGAWINSIPVITPGKYTLNPITSPTNNCYRINSSYSSKEFFVVEYRRKLLPFESQIPGSGLLVYRINTTCTGNSEGPPDEVYIYRPSGTLTVNGNPTQAYYSSLAGRTSINKNTNPSPFLSDGTQGGLNIYDVTAPDSTISFTLGTSTGISENNIPEKFSLEQNYPNPFNPGTVIKFSIENSELVTLKVYDILGKEIAILINKNLQPGTYEIPFSSNQLPGGIYFYNLKAGENSKTMKMILLK